MEQMKKTKFFLDTASLDEILYWKKFDLVDGVTTNPKLLSDQNCEPLKRVKEICKNVTGPVSAQITETDEKNMIEQGIMLSKISKNIVVKIPLIENGVSVAKTLAKKKIRLNITLGFDPSQVLFFRNIDISYFSFIVGRVEDFGVSNRENISKLKQIININKMKCELLCASIRNTEQLIVSIISGSEIITVPPKTWKSILNNKFSLDGQKDFLNSWIDLKKNKKGYTL